MVATPESLLPRLRLGARLGSGAAGEVFAGLLDDDEVAVKLVRGPLTSAMVRRATREAWVRERRTALVLARHPHPNTLTCFAAFEVPAGYTREHIAAGDGVIVLERGERIPLPIGHHESVLGPLVLDGEERIAAALRAGRIVIAIASALAHMHSVVKTIHRDVKPDNLVMVGDRICLIDFSAARTQLYTLQRATSKQGIGTMGYLAPEMYARDARYCSKVDIWALGVTVLQYFNCGKPCGYGEFHKLTSALQMRCDAERLADERSQLDATISQELSRQLPDEDGPVAALRELLRYCFRVDPAERPGAVALLRKPELLALAISTSSTFDVPQADVELLEDAVEKSVTVADLMQEFMWRFSHNPNESLGAEELNLLRDGLHRSLEQKDERSLELLDCWLKFVRDCPDVSLEDQDVTSGRCLLHAVVQSHRQEALFEMIEDWYDADKAAMPRLLVNLQDEDGRSPLWLACVHATSPVVSLRLLERMADPNAADSEGVTPLERCLDSGFNRPGERREDVLTVLIAFGAKPAPHLLEKCTLIPSIRKALQLSVSEARAQVEVWQAEAERACKLRCKLQDFVGRTDHVGDSLDVEAIESSGAATAIEKVDSSAVGLDFDSESAEKLNSSVMIATEEVAEPVLQRTEKIHVAAAEDLLKAHLLNHAGHHTMTAFRAVGKTGARIHVKDLVKTLKEVLPEEDADALEQKLRDQWSKGLGYKDFAAWLNSPSKDIVDARRRLPAERRRRSPARRSGSRPVSREKRSSKASVKERPASPAPLLEETTPERAAGLTGDSAEIALVRGVFLRVFRRLDLDGSNSLDLEQFTRGYELLVGSAQGSQIVDGPLLAFSVADSSKSEEIDEDEWLEWTMSQVLPGLKTSHSSLVHRLERWLADVDT